LESTVGEDVADCVVAPPLGAPPLIKPPETSLSISLYICLNILLVSPSSQSLPPFLIPFLIFSTILFSFSFAVF